MRFAKWIFLLAGSSGILMLVPLYFGEEQFGRDYPPAVAHPQLYYGFIGVTLAWQFMFVVIGLDPLRFRPAMLPAILEKASFSIAMPILYFQERISAAWLGFAAMDGTLGVLFIISYLLTRMAGEKSLRESA